MLQSFSRTVCGARCYATGKGGSDFLADLMKRIDRINTNMANLKTAVDNEPKTVTPKPVKASAQKDATQNVQLARQPKKIAVKDHPLQLNTFRTQAERKPRSTNRNSNRNSYTNRNSNTNRDQRRPQSAANRSRQSNRPRGQKRQINRAVPQSIVQKKLEVRSLQPVLTGDTFFHGKLAKVGLSTQSRVAAAAKQTLLQSKYPYKLPKSIVDRLLRYQGNKFLLQKNFSLDVDAAEFGGRVNSVVRGKAEGFTGSANAMEQDVQQELMRRGDLSMGQRLVIFDVVSGAKNPKELLAKAAWNKL